MSGKTSIIEYDVLCRFLWAYKLKKFHSIPILLRTVIRKEYHILSNAFFVSIDIIL